MTIPVIYLVLDNVKYSGNLGPIFRIADALKIKKIFFCKNNTEELNVHQVRVLKKTSRGLINHVKWEYAQSCTEVLRELKAENVSVYCIETGESSQILSHMEYKYPLALVFGSENYGISQEVIDMADATLKIPMLGTGKSLNVASCLSIAVYEAVRKFL